MQRLVGPRTVALILGIGTVVYCVLLWDRALLFIGSGEPIGVIMGWVLLLLPAFGIWGVARELWFGVQSERLGRILDAEGGMPRIQVPLLPSGRIDKRAMDPLFDRFADAVEADEGDWRAWFRLGLAYDAAGDRRRARSAVRSAARLERAVRRRG